MIVRTGQSKWAARTGQPERVSQIVTAGQEEDRQSETGRTGRQNVTGRTGQAAWGQAE
jgi:hypothetical protein